MINRVNTKIGEVFRTTEQTGVQKYLQLVYIDPADLNSDVVVVFKNAKSANIDEIVRGPVEFYMHTTTKQGIKAGFWEKVGSASVVVNIDDLRFKIFRNQEFVDVMRMAAARNPSSALKPAYLNPYWDVWRLGDQSFKSVPKDEGDALQAEEGMVYPALHVVNRMQGKQELSQKVWPKM